MKTTNNKIQRQTRIRKKIGTVTLRPRLSVFRSNRYIYAQIINKNGDTVLGMSEMALKTKKKLSSMDLARELGKTIAKMSLEKKIKEVVFDKGRFTYHGKVAAVAAGAREGGLKF